MCGWACVTTFMTPLRVLAYARVTASYYTQTKRTPTAIKMVDVNDSLCECIQES